MLRIGDFARLGGVTVRALRHYEAEGLLAPAQVDEATGYRSYRSSSWPRSTASSPCAIWGSRSRTSATWSPAMPG